MLVTMNSETVKALKELVGQLETRLSADVVSIIGDIRPGLDSVVRTVLESLPGKKPKLAIVLQTGGGIVEVAERIVNVIRNFYGEVAFIIPDTAMSAGTVLAMSGDAIMMDYFSCLGPIDPQVVRDDKLVPVLSYLLQWERLVDKSKNKILTEAEFLIMRNMDIAELHKFEMARELYISLLKQWLSTYKFKDWKTTEDRKIEVTPEMREERAQKIAEQLMKHDRWGSHDRGIPMKILRDEINLKIDDFGADPVLSPNIRNYFGLLVDFIVRNKLTSLVHSREFS
jgi:membrane-bound ClpP family serine protease